MVVDKLQIGEWRPNMIAETIEVENAIREVHIDINNDPDQYEWCEGWQLSFHKAWDKVQEQGTKRDWYELVWHSKNNRKMSFISYPPMISQLKTHDWLWRSGITNDSLCVLCEKEEESVHHLFFQCAYTIFIWCTLKLKFDLVPDTLSSKEEEAIQMLTRFKEKDQIRDLACVTFTATIS